MADAIIFRNHSCSTCRYVDQDVQIDPCPVCSVLSERGDMWEPQEDEQLDAYPTGTVDDLDRYPNEP